MTATDKSPDESSSNGGSSQTPVALQTPFLYQNSQTGQSSSAPLTARQLCRILCPAKGSASTSLINTQTLLIGYDPVTHTYDSAGWRTANSTPLLREACLSWYYESREGVKGPVSTRELAGVLSIDTESEDGSGNVINEKARVFPTDSSDNGQWARIQDLALLKLAIEALAEVKSMPMTWPANDEESPNEQISNMTYNNGENDSDSNEVPRQKVHDELEAFLSSTDHLAPHAGTAGDDGESDGEEYESDGGTRYVRDSRTGNWVHEALAPKKEKKNVSKVQQTSTVEPTKDSANALPGAKKRKRSKPKFSAKNARNWIYVTGLPANTNEEEVANYFSKVGILELDPETQKPKVKLYRDKKGKGGSGVLKGDASICYARQESVELALQILDENLFRDGAILSVQRAKFEQHGNFDEDSSKGGRRMVSEAQRKVARLAALQAVGWDEGENGRIAGGLKGLRIIVLKNMFDPVDLANDANDEKLIRLEKEVHAECESFGSVEKITVFSKHPAGVLIVKFTQPNAASDAVNELNGKERGNGRKVQASYWDGVTDYTCRDVEKEQKETEKRLDAFGDWLENQELPDEFKLKVEE
ncbi:hypothetical protein ACHAWF_010862 [Thalassiosira exigua]